MSGHSKWHNIQKKKGAADVKRGSLFTKHAKAITVATKMGGGPDIEFNFQLRVAVESAKAVNMPKDNIERAIKRGAGDSNDGNQIVEIIYEGFGPGGSALLIKCLTDNRNRSIAEVRHTMNKFGGNLGGQGTVMWMFQLKGVIAFVDTTSITDRDAFELTAIDAGAEDILEDEGLLRIITSVKDLQNVQLAVTQLGAVPEGSDVEYLSNEDLTLEQSDHESLQTLVEALDELDDVDTVYTNEA